ncbi:uncharacterized protein A1O5_13460, partial [Cladophialophora psammophila CBS 110553]
HSNSVTAVTFSHDSSRLASASRDETVRIWDAHSSACLLTLDVGWQCGEISFVFNDSYLKTDTGIIDISALSGPITASFDSRPSSQRYRGLGINADRQ